jgi:hypothetical protein
MTDIPSGHDGAEGYEICVKGHLAPRWSTWFDDMELIHHDDGTTVIKGMVTDQTALHGLLRKINDIGLPLVSVTLTVPDPSMAGLANPTQTTSTK